MIRTAPPRLQRAAPVAEASLAKPAGRDPVPGGTGARAGSGRLAFARPAAGDPPEASTCDLETELQRLQAAVGSESAERHRLERELAATQAALSRACVELAGTREEEQRARHQASHDRLTGLPNRLGFHERLQAALVDDGHPGAGCALFYIDLDGFKPINDAYGHDAGDELLRIVAARLSRALRADDVVGRLGGDEFACLLTAISSRGQLELMARKLFAAVAAPVTIGRVQLTVCPSIGIALSPGDGVTADALLKHADAAMYRAKRQHSGHEFFTPGSDNPPETPRARPTLPPWRTAIAAARRRRPQQ